MGFLKKLFGIGVTAGATVAAVRVADKYKENNPDGVQDVNGDGKVDAQDVFAEVKKAATEVYQDTAAAIREKRAQTNPQPEQAQPQPEQAQPQPEQPGEPQPEPPTESQPEQPV